MPFCLLPCQNCACRLQVDILCTHPMFGPDSGSGSWKGLNFMYEKVRVGGSSERQRRLSCFLEARFSLPTIYCMPKGE